MLFPDERIGCNGKKRVVIVGAKRAEIEQLTCECGLEVEERH
jgi:hypothetical protein